MCRGRITGLKNRYWSVTTRESIGTTLLALNRLAFTNRIIADNIATSYYFAMKQIGELGDWPRDEIDQVGELSVVSVSLDGTSDWISLSVPLTATDKGTGGPLSIGAPTYSIREIGTPVHFGFGVLGKRDIVNRLLGDNRSESDKHSRSPMMTRYYRLKRAGQLDRFTSPEAIILARELVQATIELAPESAGVGGPIDIAIVTTSGFHWIQRKCGVAPLPTPLIRVTNSNFGHSPQSWIRCNALVVISLTRTCCMQELQTSRCSIVGSEVAVASLSRPNQTVGSRTRSKLCVS